MDNSEFDLEIKTNDVIVITIKPNPGMCCMECVSKFLKIFIDQLTDAKTMKRSDSDLH